ncbi:MAG: hypothetical protein RLZZ293_461 [Pseudomonadota bacterium]|jgi:CDP-4-dehydro-6-deoxyglucose reductase
MAYTVRIQQASVEFYASEQDNLLDSALQAQLNLPHGCKSGSCGACKCKVVTGDVELTDYSSSALSEDEITDNQVLLCKAHAKSDLILDIPNFSQSFPIKTLPAKIENLTKVGNVAIIQLKLPANQKLAFYPGQYVDLIYNGESRSYSIASAPHQTSLELNIRYRLGGTFSEAVWTQMAVGSIVRIRGPLGNFTLQNSNSPILMVCTGTGFAPIQAILQQMALENNQRAINLVWGNFTANDFYNVEQLKQLSQQLNLQLTLCTDQETEGFYTGLVTQYVEQNFPDLAKSEVYACGNPAMIENLFNLATNKLNLNKANFFSDVFTPTA